MCLRWRHYLTSICWPAVSVYARCRISLTILCGLRNVSHGYTVPFVILHALLSVCRPAVLQCNIFVQWMTSKDPSTWQDESDPRSLAYRRWASTNNCLPNVSAKSYIDAVCCCACADWISNCLERLVAAAEYETDPRPVPCMCVYRFFSGLTTDECWSTQCSLC